MAYLPDRRHDVFVSYAHVDNLPDREGLKGWVEQFTSQLDVGLQKRLGKKLDVWRDPELRRAQLFDRTIEQAIRGAGILVLLLSRTYLHSDYCRKEIEWFVHEAGASLVVGGDHLRIFPVLLYHLPPADWPAECQGCSGFPFYDPDPELDQPLDPSSRDFSVQLGRLAQEIIHLVGTLQRSAPPPAETTQVRVQPPFKVFFAEPADDLRKERRQFAAELEKQGIAVLPSVPPPYEKEAHAEKVGEACGQADLAVHLLSSLPGRPVEDEEPHQTFPVVQARVGLERSRSQLVLMPEELEISLVEDPEYRRFLQELADRPREANRLELVRTSRHLMLNEILARKKKLMEAAAEAARIAAGGPLTAFIDLHLHDVPHATDLLGYLAQREVTPVMVPSADFSPKRGLAAFEENLRRAQIFIVVYGKVARPWVENRLEEAFKLIVSHRLKTRMAVFLAPPRKSPEEVEFPSVFCPVADNMEHFDPASLSGILGGVPS